MAFVKRNWLARIGIGLNKFIIGDKDGEGKQTLTNSPDSVTQQGDVISADNLNDLEDRIESEFISQSSRINAKVDKLTKIWENPSPSAVFMGQEINNLAVDVGTEAIAIEYYATYENPSLCRAIKVLHFGSEASTNFVLEQLRPVSSGLYVHLRGVSISKSGSSLAVTFDSSDMWYLTASGNSQYEGGGRNCTPLAIYKVNAF